MSKVILRLNLEDNLVSLDIALKIKIWTASNFPATLLTKIFSILFYLKLLRGIGGIVDSESVLRSAWILLSRVRDPPLAPMPDGGLKA
ncbi:hypothetical protein PoB_001390200 [Plakobranchus ocellatus]|uniref:Uncharacterized protein n=1 Tax=Plakobranchus ocellatus TaxID=259542 RepID=A0AAV3YYW8_9GAST|nr:hypothetical protein PoB_001390200 [Plakobranchus ocellatus]